MRKLLFIGQYTKKKKKSCRPSINKTKNKFYISKASFTVGYPGSVYRLSVDFKMAHA
jgi:hypothetical protein